MKLGDSLPLTLQLFDGDETKHPRAFVQAADGVDVPGSPVALTSRGGGFYSNFSVAMPSASFVTVRYKVYDDPSFATLSSVHSDAVEVFTLETTQETIRIAYALEAVLEDETLYGAVETDTVIGAHVADAALDIEIEINPTLVGTEAPGGV